MNVWFYTFGCKVNQYETELLKQSFEKRGHSAVLSSGSADVCVINTCTVTAQSDIKLRQLIRRLRRENPAAVIALCGCHPQAHGESSEAAQEADVIAGTENKQRLPELVESFVESGCKTVEILPTRRDYPESEELIHGSRKTRGIIKIQDGCDRFCSYCIIPYARGRSRSKPLEAISSEAKTLVEAGHKEIVAVGINLSDYGKGTGVNIADAVEAILNSGAVRVRLGSLEPEELTEDIIDRLAGLRGLCPHFHLALQSGCNKTLREMRRKYTAERYRELVEHLRKRFPNCSVTTDIMVGFPGETDEDFNESLGFVKEIAFADGHIFPFSPRIGTPAASRSDQVPEEIKAKRAQIMARAVEESRDSYLDSLVGQELQVIFEREKSPDFHQGHSEGYQLVKVKHFTDTLFRELRSVKIISAENGCLFGEIVQR